MKKALPGGPFLWTWDHSTNWKKNEHGKQVSGANNDYTKRPEAFIDDYTRLIRWSAENGIKAVGVVGFLRDCHGGVNAARYIADFAADHGVILYEIAGLAAYNGVYYDGSSEWCLDNFLKDNPDCLAVDINGKPLIRGSGILGPRVIRRACLSKQKTRDYVARSVEWVFKEIPSLGGFSMETGDDGTCQCPECRKRRAVYEDWVSTEDMALMYPKCIEAIRSVKPEAMIICEIYQHFLPIPLPEGRVEAFGYGTKPIQAQILSQLPKDVYLSWVADYCQAQWKETDLLPEPLREHKHLMRCHYGSQWMDGMPSSRHALALEKIREMCYLSMKAGIEAVSLFGESSAYNTNNELNYLAQIYFSKHPSYSLDSFMRDVAAEKLGGYEAACDYVTINERANNSACSWEDVCTASRYVAALQGEQKRRWIWLNSYIASIHWDNTALVGK